jgi:hypothetical protein
MPSVAAGFCLMDVNDPLRISLTLSGRSGMPPGCGAGGSAFGWP